MSTTRSSSPKARATDPRWRDATLLLCAHGVRGAVGVARTHAAAIAASNCFAAVEACCLHGRPPLEAALERVATARAYLVPLLMAEGRTSDTLTARVLAARDTQPTPIKLCRPVGSHPALADLISHSAQRLCEARAWPRSGTGLLLLGHGTPRHARSSRSLRRHAARIAETRGFATVACAFLDDAPRVPDALRSMTAAHRVAVGFFADAGPHGADDVERRLADATGDVAYAGPIGCDPGLVDLILDQVRQVDGAVLAA